MRTLSGDISLFAHKGRNTTGSRKVSSKTICRDEVTGEPPVLPASGPGHSHALRWIQSYCAWAGRGTSRPWRRNETRERWEETFDIPARPTSMTTHVSDPHADMFLVFFGTVWTRYSQCCTWLLRLSSLELQQHRICGEIAKPLAKYRQLCHRTGKVSDKAS